LGEHYPLAYPPGHRLHSFQQHHQCDVRVLFDGRVAHSMRLEGQEVTWDLMIAHPPCTYLANSGARYWRFRQKEQKEAIAFVQWLMDCPVPRIAIENPIGILSTAIMKPAQIIQPFQFGHPEWKSTCLWLNNLPLLKPTNVVTPDPTVGGGKKPGRISSRLHRLPPGPDRARLRSLTFPGIAAAMVEQWGHECEFEVDPENPYFVRCTCGAVKDRGVVRAPTVGERK
jgi:hypothetical protein